MADNENNNEIIIPEGGHLINNYGPFPGPCGPGPGPEHHDGCNCPNLTIPQTTGLPRPDLVPDDFEKCLSYEEQICRLRQDFRNATAPDVDATGTIINNGGEPEVDVDAARVGTHSWLFNFIFKNAIGQQGPKGDKGDKGDTGEQGPKGDTGATGAQGPQGEKGDKGDKGDTGATGAQGPKGDTGATGSQGPKGDTGNTGPQGEQGPAGAAATVTVGTTTTGEPGTNASVTNSGTSSAAVLNFTIPKGAKGDTGATGATGPQGPKGDTGATGPQGPKGDTGSAGVITATASVDSGTGTPGVSVTKSGTDEAPNFAFAFTNLKGATGAQGPQGETGATGATGPQGATGATGPQGPAGTAATITVGTTTTGEPGTNASVTNSGTSSAAVLNFTIPKGAKGDTGATGATGPQGPQGETGATGAQGPQGEQGPAGQNGTNGTNGKDGNIWWTSTAAPTTPNYTFTIANLVGPTGATPKVGDLVLYSYYRYTITSVGSTTVLTGSRQSFRGATGAQGPAGPTEAKTYAATAAPTDNTTYWTFAASDVAFGQYGPDVGDNILYDNYLYVVSNSWTDPGSNLYLDCNARYQIASGGGGGGGSSSGKGSIATVAVNGNTYQFVDANLPYCTSLTFTEDFVCPAVTVRCGQYQAETVTMLPTAWAVAGRSGSWVGNEWKTGGIPDLLNSSYQVGDPMWMIVYLPCPTNSAQYSRVILPYVVTAAADGSSFSMEYDQSASPSLRTVATVSTIGT